MRKLEAHLAGQIKRGGQAPETHFQDWLEQLKSDPEATADLRVATKSFLLDNSFTRTLTTAGVTTEQSFLSELRSRFFHKFFPPIYPDRDIISTLQKMELAGTSFRTLLNLSGPTLQKLLETLAPDDPKVPLALRARLMESMEILAIRISNQGLSRVLYERLKVGQEQSAFLNLIKLLQAYSEKKDEASFKRLTDGIHSCINAAQVVREQRSQEGISLDLTFRLIIIYDNCKRLLTLSRIHWGLLTRIDTATVEKLLREILSAELKTPAVRELLSRYLSLVFFEITEHTGKTGEKYIAQDAAEFRQMAIKGLIGGVIVGGLSILKPWISLAKLSPFALASAYGFIYSIIFLLIYYFKGVLATKQPAMTASSLARALDEENSSQSYLWGISDLVILTFRTQTIAVLGNFVLAMPVAYLVYQSLSLVNLTPLPTETATYFVQSLHPLKSLTIFYAAVTGVILSITGMFAGAVTNWFIFNKIGRRLEQSTLIRQRVDGTRTRNFSRWLSDNISYLAGNIALGFALGSLPVVGFVMGFPLDVRHITFASAQLGSALAHFGAGMVWNEFGWAVLGVALVGFINLTTSFGLTLYVVFRSRRITMTKVRQLLVLCLKRVVRNPLVLFSPKSLRE